MPPDASDVSRRAFLAASLTAPIAESQSRGAPAIRALVEPANLVYEKPVPRSEEGIPIGNGRMGSLVWTTSTQLKFQINLPDGNSLPMYLFDLCNSGELRTIANATFDAAFRNGIGPDTSVQVLSKLAIAGALLGRPDTVRYLIPAQIQVKTPERGTAYKNGGVLANRMTLREGPQALDAQRLGRASEALNLSLLQSNPPLPGEDPVIKVFPAWPKEQDASFQLLARGGFLVTSSFREGKVEFVEIESLAGEECRLANPWNDSRGEVLRYPTTRGQRIRVVPA